MDMRERRRLPVRSGDRAGDRRLRNQYERKEQRRSDHQDEPSHGKPLSMRCGCRLEDNLRKGEALAQGASPGNWRYSHSFALSSVIDGDIRACDVMEICWVGGGWVGGSV